MYKYVYILYMNLSSELLFILLCFPLRIIISILPDSELLVRFFNKIKIIIITAF